jgi:D-aminoacyl-tRNA deacylase
LVERLNGIQKVRSSNLLTSTKSMTLAQAGVICFSRPATWNATVRAVLQRVSSAAVAIADQQVGRIDSGLLVLVGVGPSDTSDDVTWLAGKIARLRIFADDAGRMNRSVSDSGGGCLVVSQFTLYAATASGNRPSFTSAAAPAQAIPLYEAFCQQLSSMVGRPVATGRFGADMQVSLVNDGPVTICLDSRRAD